MKSLQEFLQNFFKNQGQFIFISLLIAKICAFSASVLVIRLLPVQEFGTLSIVISVFSIFAAFNGMGSQQSLLRFGSLESDVNKKEHLANYLFKTGLFYQLILSVLFFVFSIFFTSKYEDIVLFFVFFAIRLIGYYFLNHIQSSLRVSGKNREFAKVNNVTNILGLLLLVTLTYCFGLIGYLISVAVTPFISLFWYKRSSFNFRKEPLIDNKKELWYYGLHSSGTALMSDALFAIDILLLGFMLNEDAVAHYKVAILIPTNITFLAITFMQSDFTVLAKNYRDKFFLKNYIFNYYKLFFPICLIIFLGGFIFKEWILDLFFGDKYSDNGMLFSLFLFIFCFNMLSRNLYGNLLSAVGKMKVNTMISFSALLLILGLSLLLVPKYGILGMATSMLITLMFTGFTLMYYFYIYLKKLN